MASQDFDRANHDMIDVAIICMIADTELRAICEVLEDAGGKETEPSEPDTGWRYYKLATPGGITVRIVVACCPGQGNMEAAITTQVVLFRHYPRYAILCGIAGGMQLHKVALGDVVIGVEVAYRRYTKVQADGALGSEVFNVPSSDAGLMLKQRFLSSDANLKKIQSSLNDGDLFAIHDEKILSWDLVLDDAATKDQLHRYVDRQLSIVEMEGAGFLKAVAAFQKHALERPWRSTGKTAALIVRGVSDPAADKAASDTSGKGWRRIAARNAAQTVTLILQTLRPNFHTRKENKMIIQRVTRPSGF